MLPMGTIMTGCMFAGVIYAGLVKPLTAKKPTANVIDKLFASLLLLAGSWNVLWYASQNFGSFWGKMALLSGLLMWLTSALLFQFKFLPQWLVKAKPLVILALAACCFKYGYTIYSF